MERQITKLKSLFPIIMIVFFLLIIANSCYYDNEEYLYPNPTNCDTTNVTYAATVAPILATSCNSCHSSSSPSAGIITDNYNGLQVVINNGKFRGAINHLSGYSPMPKGGSKLNSCDLTKINTWLDAGAPNN